MSASPFHGIFSALGAGSSKGGFPWDEGEETAQSAPAPIHQAQPDGVGKVAVDIFEHEGYYVIKAPIAGVP